MTGLPRTAGVEEMMQRCEDVGSVTFAAHVKEQVKRQYRTEAASMRQGQKCYSCGKTGHFKQDCRSRPGVRPKTPCPKRRRKGHWPSECRGALPQQYSGPGPEGGTNLTAWRAKPNKETQRLRQWYRVATVKERKPHT